MRQFLVFLIGLVLSSNTINAQKTSVKDTAAIKELLANQEISKAVTALENALIYHEKQKDYQALANYIPLVGHSYFIENDYSKAITKIKTILATITQSKDTIARKHALSSFAKVYHAVGDQINAQALALFNTGQTQASIEKIQEAIAMLQNAIGTTTDKKERLSMMQRKFALVDNLGGFYRALENMERMIQIITYSYEEKKKFLPEGDRNLVISNAILAHAHLVNRDLDLAATYSDFAFNNMDQIAFAKDYILLVRASIYENKGNTAEAKKMYQQMEASYREKSNLYSLGFLDALIETSRFYSKTHEFDKAIALAREGYVATHQPEFNNELVRFYQTANLAQIYFEDHQFKEALHYSNEALGFFSKSVGSRGTLLDSVQNMRFKPQVMAIKLSSQYAQEQMPDNAFLENLLLESDEAIQAISLVKRVLTSTEDVNTLLLNSADLIDFRKTILYHLFENTEEERYLQQLVGLHESNIYSRIRARLNLKNVLFSSVPEAILKRETQLKENISRSLSDSIELKTYFKAEAERNAFLDSLKKDYPKYYKLRYSEVEASLEGLQQKIPKNTTLIRYFFIDSDLKVYVASSSAQRLISLNFDKNSNGIEVLSDYRNDFNAIINASNSLYNILWEPLAGFVQTENVIIYPDQELFNLSFELLSPVSATSFKDFAMQSLLQKHNISYNYSLLLAGKEKELLQFKTNFVAFAPEFNQDMKQDYELAISDSIHLDYKYLTLLPQPFVSELSKKYSKRYKGSSFLNQNASKQLFMDHAGEHKIIHIGTHAENNNVSPELSRLVFAKNVTDSEYINDNYLYTFEIYNQNLNSNLTVLTACETGKPSYQPGEGMISLAHAFNYAGSESILTSLWQIDEQSTAIILDYFYAYLEDGMPKDKALKMAKLDYLASAEGRTLHPQYWAGLVLMGSTTPIALETTFKWWYWALAILALGLMVFYLIGVKMAKK